MISCKHTAADWSCHSVWPIPPWTFLGGPVMRLHVIFQFRDTPQGKKICYQVLLLTSSTVALPLAAIGCDVSIDMCSDWASKQGVKAHSSALAYLPSAAWADT